MKGYDKAIDFVKKLNDRTLSYSGLTLCPISIIPEEDYDFAVAQLYGKDRKKRKRAFCLLARLYAVPITAIAFMLDISYSTVKRYITTFEKEGATGLFSIKKPGIPPLNERHPEYAEKVFSILHSPPSSFGINRTSWRLIDIKKVMSNEGIIISTGYISKVIKEAGYIYRKSKTVLTSNDPDYRAKLENITNILSNLKPTEKFFSIDEYGPFSVKMKGGKSLVKKGHFKTVPQWQKSKGWLIMTAALELSSNQVTHFYSSKKDTDEMIKLLDILIEEYSDAETIYLSWDAASWHASKKLYERIDKINNSQHNTSIVKTAPLPSRAQFLNVIESVFSGMARAIIHNSDYQSVDECKKAIDLYFEERNQAFKLNPKRAGNKIWGDERVSPVFSEYNNCKDPRWR
jgi:transposase